MNNLVIVESPAKAKTIERYLGNDYKVLSSYGHIRDLKPHDISVDIDHNFEPIYEIPEDKKEVVKALRKAAKEAEVVWLASDEDREGEAISWHLSEVLKLKEEQCRRIVFHEITKPAILAAIETPRTIDHNLVNAQQARRVLDRLVGFELSPILWRKVKPSLSAGRVQSVAVRIIVEREREITGFTTENYYRITAILLNTAGESFKAELNTRLRTLDEAQAFLNDCVEARLTIDKCECDTHHRAPAPPFTTSTLQQEASRKLSMSVSQTMSTAQKLYEAGLITYMRTDSMNLSSLFLAAAKQEIISTQGAEYHKERHYRTKAKGAQEAHEAIRPTDISCKTINGTQAEKRLYNLIRQRTLASQMSDAELEKTTATITINTRNEKFVAQGEVIKFDGFLRAYKEGTDDETQDENNTLLPTLSAGELLQYKDIKATERFTQHPPRYTEASLVHKLEELGIGRPSTYAPTISTIMARDYVNKDEREGTKRNYTQLVLSDSKIEKENCTEITGKEKGKLRPTDLGLVVNDFLVETFADIMDYNFTADVEQSFDAIADGDKEWTAVIKSFYSDFHPTVEKVIEMRSERKPGERVLGNDPESGKPVIVKIGRYGPVVQLGENNKTSGEKPVFADMGTKYSIETITLEEALSLFKLSRVIGKFEDSDVSIGQGRFGPYVKHGKSFVSIPKTYDPMTLTISEAVILIINKRKADAEKVISTFEDDKDMQVLNGRFGAYIAYKGNNYRIAKTINAKSLTLEQCLEIVSSQPASKSNKKTAKKK